MNNDHKNITQVRIILTYTDVDLLYCRTKQQKIK